MSERAFASNPARQAAPGQTQRPEESLAAQSRMADPVLRRAIDRFWQTGEASSPVLVWLHRTLHSPERVRQTIQAARQNARQNPAAGAAIAPVKLAAANHQSSVTERAMEFIRRSGGGSLSSAVSTRAKQSLGASTENVKVHQGQEAAQLAAEAGAKAFSIGNHIVLGNDVANDDNFILAHETAHAVQQQSASAEISEFSKSDSSYQAMEQNANLAAQAMMNGGSAQIAPASSLRLQCFDSYEHVRMGDAGGMGQTMRLNRDPSVVLTWGEVVALGDFYSSPSALLNAQPDEVRRLLAIFRRQATSARRHGGRPSDAESAQTETELENTTLWRTHRVLDSNGDRTMRGALEGEETSTYLDLASHNNDHFSPDNMERWRLHHGEALRLAQQARTQTANPTERDRLLNQARMTDAFASHFLTDAFSAGHLVSGNIGRATAATYWASNRAAIINMLARALHDDPTYARPPLPIAERAMNLVIDQLGDNIPSLLLKLVHDYLNESGRDVQNARGDTWTVYGDRNLHRAPVAERLAGEAVRLSHEEIEHAALSGRAEPLGAENLVPAAVLESGTTFPIRSFASDPAIFTRLLRNQVMVANRSNPFYRLIVENVGVLRTRAARGADGVVGEIEIRIEQARRDIAAAADRTRQGAQRTVDDITNAPARSERWLEWNIEQLYPRVPR